MSDLPKGSGAKPGRAGAVLSATRREAAFGLLAGTTSLAAAQAADPIATPLDRRAGGVFPEDFPSFVDSDSADNRKCLRQ